MEKMNVTMECDKFSLASNSNVIRSLLVNVHHLSTMRNHVQMGNIKFESLCHGLSSSLQEMSLRLIKMSESDKEIRCQVLECRKMLLECASNLVLNAKHPFKVFPYVDAVAEACIRALEVSERHTIKVVVQAANPVLETLDALEKSTGYKSLFLNIKLFSTKLHAFLEVAARACQDIKREKAKNDIIIRAMKVKKLLPHIIQSLRESLRHPMNSHARSNREYFFKIMKIAVNDIVNVFHDVVGNDNKNECEVGLFISKLDSVLKYCEEDDASASDWSADVEWLVKFSLSVARVCKTDEEEEIVSTCHSVLRESKNLKTVSEDSQSSSSEIGIAKDILRDVVETLEQIINNSLLKLIIDLFCCVHSPLDELIHQILKSSVSPPDRLPEDLDDLVVSFDDRSDILFHIAHFTAFCTTDKARSLAINTSLHLMQELENELIPACLKLYFNPEDHGARFHLRSVRNIWLQEIEILESNILGIVDATAFCYVINQEARNEAALIKKEQYSQDKVWLHEHGSRLIKMCQRAVDFAWKDIAANKQEEQQHLPDDHPIVKVERSTWEVQGALRLVLNDIEDLNLHKTMIRRVQVLVTCLGIMSHFLYSKNDTDAISVSKVRVLTSVSRITIGQDARMTVLQQGGNSGAGVSRSKAMSFRSVQRKNSMLQSKIESDAKVIVDQSMAKLAEEAKESIPFHTRKMTRMVMNGGVTLSSPKIRTGFDFTEIFDELSALSNDISKSLDCCNGAELPQPSQSAKKVKKDVSLRQMAFKNAAGDAEEHTSGGNAAVGTSAERLRQQQSLDAKLAAIRSDLEGTEY